MEFVDRMLGRPTLQVLVGDVKQWLRANGDPRAEFALERMEVLIYLDAEPTKLYLGNLLNDYRLAARRARKEVVARFMGALASNQEAVPDTYASAQPLLMPVLRTMAGLGVARLSTFQLSDPEAHFGPVYRPFAADLAIALVVDQPTSMAYVTVERLAQWGISFEQALDDAVHNLRGLPQDGGWSELAPGVWSGEWGDAYDSSRLLLPDLFHRLDIKEPVAIAPYRNALLVTSAKNEAGIQLMLDLAEQNLEQNTRWLSFRLLALDGTKWSERRAPANAQAQQAKLELFNQSDAYAAQKQLLDQQYDERNIDIFVATFSLLQKDGDDIYSHSVWSEGVDSLLPKTERVSLFYKDGDEAHHLTLDWDEMHMRFGSLLEATNYEPIRYRVRSFPPRPELTEA